MTGSVLATPRRVTVVAPTARVDVSLPAQSTMAELVPALVRMAAAERAGSGWRLGRLGADAFDSSSTVIGAGIRDGEVLILSPRGAIGGGVVVDDVADGIAAAAGEPALVWRAALTRALALAATVLAFGGAAVAVAVSAPPWPVGTALAGVLALVLLLGAAAMDRMAGDGAAAAALAGAGMVASLMAGLAVVTVDGGIRFGAASLASGCSALTLYVLAAAVAVRAHRGLFVAAALMGVTGCIAAAASLATGAQPSSVAAVVTAAALALTPMLPMASLRLSRFGLPRVPADAAGFRVDEPTMDSYQVLMNTRAATRTLGALLAAAAALSVASTVVLLGDGTTWARALAAATGLALLLRARAYSGVGQRAALVSGGAAVLLLTGANLATTVSGAALGPLVAGALSLGVVGLAYAVRAQKNQPSPYWGRLLEVAEFVAVVSLVPLAAAVLNLYAAARSLGG